MVQQVAVPPVAHLAQHGQAGGRLAAPMTDTSDSPTAISRPGSRSNTSVPNSAVVAVQKLRRSSRQ
jgi:hypothetical protein